jgi:uncharacterized membrane protein YgdD (TMEM256/DUF423 family)
MQHSAPWSSRSVLLTLSATLSFLAVAMGAFGAHALKTALADIGDAAARLSAYEVASRYHFIHAAALGWLGVLWPRTLDRLQRVAVASLLLGLVLFCGSLYALGVSGIRRLGIVTPAGGVAFLVGWACCAVSFWRRRSEPE